MRLVILLALLPLLSSLISAQTLVSASSSLDANGKAIYRVTILVARTSPPATPVIGVPYSADEVSEATQPDGAAIEHGEPPRHHDRDSQGRTRVERSLFLGPNLPETPRIVEISDVVAGYFYTLDPQNRIAHRARLVPAAGPVPPAVRTDTPPAVATAGGTTAVVTAAPMETRSERDPQVAERPGAPPIASQGDPLPGRTIEGLAAEGIRYTTVIPNYAPGTSPRIATTEVWTATELGVVLLSRQEGAAGGQRITALKNIVRAEPAHELFAVPPGYTIRDEPGRFSIEWTLQE